MAFRTGFSGLAASALALAAASLAPPARAQDTAPAGSEAPAGPSLVVVADLSSNATANSQLRATLYEVARRHGYTAAGKLDVDGIAAQRSLMTAGTITVDPQKLTELRQALGVAVLVRVSKDSEDATGANARVTVVTSKGVHAQLVRVAGTGASEPLEKAMEQMLPAVLPAAAARPAAPVPPPSTAGAITAAEVKEEDVPKPAEAWARRAGLRPTYGAAVLLGATRMFNVPYSDTNPTGAIDRGTGNSWGVGGGFGVRVGLMYLPMPEPNLSSANFVAFRLGVAVDSLFFWMHPPKGFDYSGTKPTTVYGDQPLWLADGHAEIGFAIAAGHFSSDQSWGGLLIGLAYAPALQYSLDITDANSGKFRSNLAGGEASIDITRLNAGANTDPEMQIRGSIRVLAPLDDAHPGLISVGLGLIWY